jgi:hypothetical protein
MKFRLALMDGASAVLSLALVLGACGDEAPPRDDETQPDDDATTADDDATVEEEGSLPDGDDGDDDDAPADDDQPGDAGPSRPGAMSDGGSMAPRRDAAVDDAGRGEAGKSDARTPDAPEPDPVDPGELPRCEKSTAMYQANASIGGASGQAKESAHFRVYGAADGAADAALKMLEGAYSCFVDTLCWRSSGLSISGNDSGPRTKMNIIVVGSLGGAAGQMFSDARAGLSYLKVGTPYLQDPKVTVHEYGHALTYHEKGWVDQRRTGAWWETVANFVAETYVTSPLCESARKGAGQAVGRSIIELNKVIGSSHQVLVDATQGSGNYYQAWPFLTYLTHNPDKYAGLGPTVLREMFRKHMRNNETPLHVLERIAAPIKVAKIVGRYWAHMAYLDIGDKPAQDAFMSGRSRLNFANLDPAGSGSYRVKAARQPRYMGANIIPLSGSGKVTAKVASSAPFTATLAVRAANGAVRYVDLEGGSGEATLASGEEASLVVANTPDTLIQYDPFMLGADVNRGLDYTVELSGAMPAN